MGSRQWAMGSIQLNGFLTGVDFLSFQYMTNLGGSSYIERDRVKYIIHTKLGSGPKKLDDPDDALLGADGLPKSNPKVPSSIEQETSTPPCEPHEVPPENVMYLGVPWGPQWAEQWLAQWGKTIKIVKMISTKKKNSLQSFR